MQNASKFNSFGLFKSGKPMRIAFGRIFHEANAYSPTLTHLADFERMHLIEGEALMRASELRGAEIQSLIPHAELTGFRQAAALAGKVEAIPLISALAIPSGPLTRECFETLVTRLLHQIEVSLPLDGVYLALHGSMQVAEIDEAPEAHILRRVRALVGSEVKIAVSYDLHANLTAGLVDPVDVLIAYRTNPHWDLFPTGYRAGRRLIAAIRGEIKPVHAWRKLPMILGGGTSIDILAPMRAVFRSMKKLEKDPNVISASLFMVHPYTNSEALSWAVHISTDNDPALAAKLADALADRAWETRKVELPRMVDAATAIAEVAKHPARKFGPITFIDVDDIVGAGAPGGNTHILQALVSTPHALKVFVPMHDPVLAHDAWDVPIGESRNFIVRGSPGYNMPEVALHAVVAARYASAEFGQIVRLDAGTVHVVVCERAPLPIHPLFFKYVGLLAREADVIVQKNFFHYRIFYAAISFGHIPVVSSAADAARAPGATSFQRILARKLVIPMHPQVHLDDWREGDRVLRGLTGLQSTEESAPKNF